MVLRPNAPAALARTPGLPPQATVDITDNNTRVTATLPTGESVTINRFGATVTSWLDNTGREQLWLSSGAKLDGSKAIRGGIPLVFPVFGRPEHEETKALPQHGFARTETWEYLGKSSSEMGASSVKLDFGLSSGNISEAAKKAWPFTFGLLYSVVLSRDSLKTSLVVTNEGTEPFDCQVLLHTYLKVDSIDNVSITGLESSPFVDKIDAPAQKTQDGAITFSKELDRVYSPETPANKPIHIQENGETVFRITRDNLNDVVVWNPWVDKSAGMADFEPKDGWKNMVCVEAGSVKEFTRLETGDVLEGGQTIWID